MPVICRGTTKYIKKNKIVASGLTKNPLCKKHEKNIKNVKDRFFHDSELRTRQNTRALLWSLPNFIHCSSGHLTLS